MRLVRAELAPSPLDTAYVRISGEVRYNDMPDRKPEVYWFEFPKALVGRLQPEAGNAWATCLLPLAVTLGEPLQLPGAIDPVLFRNLHALMRIWKSWYRHLHIVPIEAATHTAELPQHRKVAAFFSGGVDAYYTALRHQGNGQAEDGVVIDDLIHVWGLDISLSNQQAYEAMLRAIRIGASTLGKELVLARTNIRETRLECTGWGSLYNGSALATVGLFLEPVYREVLIASSYSSDDIHPWGSTQVTDPLCSTSQTQIVHDGDVRRHEKIRSIATHPLVQKHLHVCFMLRSNMNCSRCVKCCRTMISLELLGVLDRFPTFDRQLLTMDSIGRMFSYDEFDRSSLLTLRALAVEQGRTDIATAIERGFRHTDRVERCWRVIRKLKKREHLRHVAVALEKILLRRTLL